MTDQTEQRHVINLEETDTSIIIELAKEEIHESVEETEDSVEETALILISAFLKSSLSKTCLIFIFSLNHRLVLDLMIPIS